MIGPVLALAASTQLIVDNLTGETPDLEAALNDLINIPAAMTGAFLNGGPTLDITPLMSALAPVVGWELPEGVTTGVTFGGLLSPGGSIFNALDLGNVPVLGAIPGVGPGAIGSLIDVAQVIAKAIGWDGVGNPLAPPLTPPAAAQSFASEAPGQVPELSLDSKMIAVSAPTDRILDQGTSTLDTELNTGSVDTLPATTVEDETPTESLETVELSNPDEGLSPAQSEQEIDKTTNSQTETTESAGDDAVSDDGKNPAKTADTKTSETSDTKTADTKTSETSDTKTSDTKTSDTKTSDKKTSDTSE